MSSKRKPRRRAQARKAKRKLLFGVGGTVPPCTVEEEQRAWELLAQLNREEQAAEAARALNRARSREGTSPRRIQRARRGKPASRRSRSSGGSNSSDGDDDGEGGAGAAPAASLPVRGAVRLVPVSSLTLHPQAGLVPEMSAREWADFLADVRQRGIVVPLEVEGDTVLDGRHRLKAAQELGLEQVRVVDVPLEGEDALSYLLKSALLRRHLSDDQRAMIAARLAKQNARPRGGNRKSGTAIKGVHVGPVDHPARSEAAAALGVAPTKVKKAARILNAAPKLAEEVHRGELKLGKALQAVQRQKQLRQIARTKPPEGVYRTIVVDPPWRYGDTGCLGAAEDHYPTMATEEIAALPLGERAAENAHCYLWTTNSHLEDAFRVLRAWGFEYRSLLTWTKPGMGLGRHFRNATEHVLFGTKGSLPLKRRDILTWFSAERGTHSAKPAEFFDLVERASHPPFLEAFARKQRSGWTCWGAELEALPSGRTSANEGGRP